MITTLFCLLFLLTAVHAVLDFPLQGDTVAINKNPNANTELQKHVSWQYWMLSHALSHGLGVCVVFLFVQCLYFDLNSKIILLPVVLGVLETICHFVIDYFKCKKKIEMITDQMLHLECKILWLIGWVLYFGITTLL